VRRVPGRTMLWWWALRRGAPGAAQRAAPRSARSARSGSGSSGAVDAGIGGGGGGGGARGSGGVVYSPARGPALRLSSLAPAGAGTAPRARGPALALAALAAACVAAQRAARAECVDAGLLGECDALFDKRGRDGALSRCLSKLQELYAGNEDHADLCFRIARAAYNLLNSKDPLDAELVGSADKKKRLAELAVAMASEAREVAPDDFRSFYWIGISIQAYGDAVGGTKYTLERLPEIRQSFERASQLNPNDGTVMYCLGAWCYGLADLGWVSRKLASTLFATPPVSSFGEALEFFLRAEEVEPGFWSKNTLMIARCYDKLGERAKAYEWARATAERPCSTPEDREVQKEALELARRTA
jgi:tetratricopeptide (TPR) repeat protein